MRLKTKPWTKRAVKAAKDAGIRAKLVPATEYSENHISQCLLGKRATSPFLAARLETALGIPAQEFGQIKKRVKA
jgi:plasmid maintenance system antidote protein VapI